MDERTQQVVPIRIAKLQGSGFVVDEDELCRLLTQPSLKDVPLSIIAIAGKLRSGKSFLLNFFIRYFRNKGWQNPTWIGGEDKKVDDGFSWTCHPDAHTEGIDVWPEPFCVDKNGKKIAVLLVDTQGLFDEQISPDTSAKIMALSLLFSSHQIINIKNVISATDLEHLQLCVKYAQTAESHSEQDDATSKAITFLIRDWTYPNRYPFGSDGGDQYLQSVMNGTGCEKLAAVKESIKTAFSSTRGFLMPFPGSDMEEWSHEQVTNAYIRQIFRSKTKELTDRILNPNNLMIKTRRGLEDTAGTLMIHMANVSKSFKDGEMPKIETMLESAIMASSMSATSEALQAYREEMEKGGKILNDTDFESLDKEAGKEADKTFWKRANFGPENKRKEAHQQFIKERGDLYYFFKQRNKVNRDIENIMLDYAVEKCSCQYETSTKDLTENNHIASSDTLNTNHPTERSKAMDKFDADTRSCAIKSDVESRRSALGEAINRIFQELKDINEQNTTKVRRKIKARYLGRKFGYSTAQFPFDYNENMQQRCQRKATEILAEYDEEYPGEREDDVHRNTLIQSMKSKTGKILEENEKLRKYIRESSALVVQHVLIRVRVYSVISPGVVEQVAQEVRKTITKSIPIVTSAEDDIESGVKEGMRRENVMNEENKEHKSVAVEVGSSLIAPLTNSVAAAVADYFGAPAVVVAVAGWTAQALISHFGRL